MVWCSHHFKSFQLFIIIQTVKDFSIVNETKVYVFLEFPCFLSDSANDVNVTSSSSAFSKPSLDVWKFLGGVMLKPSMQDVKHDFTSMEDESICLIV